MYYIFSTFTYVIEDIGYILIVMRLAFALTGIQDAIQLNVTLRATVLTIFGAFLALIVACLAKRRISKTTIFARARSVVELPWICRIACYTARNYRILASFTRIVAFPTLLLLLFKMFWIAITFTINKQSC
jgi:hypothetical protein